MSGEDDDFRWIVRDASCLVEEAVEVFENGEAVNLTITGEFLSCLFTDYLEEVALVSGEDFFVRFHRARTIEELKKAF